MNQKEKIIEVTTALINECEGDLAQVTARKIAAKADVGPGLINYHFGSKDQLVTECVQRIITKEIRSFVPQDTAYSDDPIESDRQRLTYWAKQVFDFFFRNKSISKVSILGDLQNNLVESNSDLTERGLAHALLGDFYSDKKRFMLFTLTSALQTAFLQDRMVMARLGYDLENKDDRDRFVESLVNELYEFALVKEI